MTYNGSITLLITGTSGEKAPTHYPPKVIHTLLQYKWTDADEKFLHDSEYNIKREVIPSHPNFSGILKSHTYAIKMYLRSNQQQRNIHCLLLPQVNLRLNNYTNKVRKLLSIVENLQKNSVPFYQGIISKIRTTSHLR